MRRSLMAGGFVVSTLWISSSFPIKSVSIAPWNTVRSNTKRSISDHVLFESHHHRRRRRRYHVDELLHDDGKWHLLNDFPTFLNQATIQSLVFLVNSLRDRHTAIWLEDFTQPVIRSRTDDRASDKVLSKMAAAMNDAMNETMAERKIELLTYHGLGVINTTLFPTWNSFFEKLLEEDSVSYQIQSTRAHVPSYDLEINPASLCSRLVSVREQIAREFVVDLDAIAEMSGTTMKRFKDGKLETPNLLFLESSVHEDYLPSPLRKGNFDLLTTLTTQEAIHRVLNMDPSVRDQATVGFLYDFYVSRIETHFTGSNWYGRAEDFLQHLLQTPPTLLQILDDTSVMIDPMQVADLILGQREVVADEWLELALDVGQSHTDIRRWQLDRLMGRYMEKNPVSGFE